MNPNDAKRNDEAYAQMMREKYHTKVSKWTKTVDIFSKDYLFVPILRRHHWLLAVVCHPGEQPQPICSQPTNDNEPIKFEGAAGRPCIIVFDSLNGVTGRSQLTYPLRYFLEREWQLRKQCERSFEKSFMPEYFPRTPKQPNDHDCALFVMEYVERLLAHPEHVLASDHIEVDLRDWFDRDKVIAKRVELVDLILKLSPNTLRSDIERLRQSRLDARSERLIRRKALMAANAKRGREKTRKSSKCVKRETTDQPHSIDIESDSTSIQEEEEEKSQKQDENNSLEILNDLQQPENSLQVIESN